MTPIELKHGDDIRTARLTLQSDPEPISAILILKWVKGGVRQEFALTPEGSGVWSYRFTDADFENLPPSTSYQAEVYATFSDTTNGTYPTRGTIPCRIYPRL